MARIRKVLGFRPTRRLGLRARITIAFGLGALLLSALLAGTTYGLTRENLLNQRDRLATDRATTNALTVKNSLKPDTDLTALLEGLSTPEGANPLVEYQGEWTALNDLEFGQANVPEPLINAVADGKPVRMRYYDDGRPILAVGVPLQSEDAMYFEGVSLVDLQDTLEGLGISLLAAAAVTTIAGALLGFWASKRVLTPLADVGEAAEAIAGGRLDTRLEAIDDPDLGSLTVSFNEMVQALEERIQRDARFASEVSHELRSPLMTLSASLEVLQNSRTVLPERAQTALDLLASDLERFQQLVEDLLEISRFDAGAIHLDLAQTRLADLVQQAVTSIVGGRVAVVVEPEAANVVVRVDRRRIGQVLANLLDNAEKYANGATAVVASAAPGVARIAVEDEGPGVPIEERSVIFDRFSRGSAGGRRGDDLGTGLGLSLVAEHIHLHGGRVWVENRLDGRDGSRFVVELPIVMPAKRGHRSSRQAELEPPPEAAQPSGESTESAPALSAENPGELT
jgi:two-component system, OmpR family, sensor histidine kinase MtrB